MQMDNPTIIGRNGKPVAPKNLGVRTWRRGLLPKCGPDRFCQGMIGALTDGAKEKGGRITAAGEFDDIGTARPEAIGVLLASANQLCVFSFCPFCGAPLRLAANTG